jgi:hypothetical protein
LPKQDLLLAKNKSNLKLKSSFGRSPPVGGSGFSLQSFLLRRKGKSKKDAFILSGVEGLHPLTQITTKKSISA